MKSNTTGVNVCQLSDEIGCERDKDCPGKQECGVDGECRDLCDTSSQCVATQICANSGECASTFPGKDRVDGEGNLLPDGDGGGVAGSGGSGGVDAGPDSSAGGTGPGGASGSGGDAGSGGSSAGSGGTAGGDASAGSGGTGGASGSGGTEDSGSDGATGAGGSSGTDAGSDATAGDGGPGYHETPDGVESIPNNTREVAVPLTTTASIYLPRGDHDWFSVTVPDAGRAQVIELTVLQQAGLRVGIEATGDGVRGNYYPIGTHTPAVGATTTVYVSAGSGATILIHFSPVATDVGLRADLSYRITPENDAQEPNNTKDQAAAIPLNTVVAAQLIEPWISDTDHAADDWYRVQLAAGAATLNLLSVPASGRFTITRVNEQGASTTIDTTAVGVSGSYPMQIPVAGTYYIRFVEYAGFMAPMAMGAKPGYMAEQYTFRVEQ